MLTKLLNSKYIDVVVGSSAVIVSCVLLRLLPHPPNFTPVIALGLFSVVTIQNKKFAFILPIVVMGLSDLIIGFHSLMMGVYLAVAVSSCVGLWLKHNMSIKNIIGSSCVSATIFFIISNSAVWAISSMYEKSIIGLIECFIMALPFFHNSLISTVVYSGAMYLYLAVCYNVRVGNVSFNRAK